MQLTLFDDLDTNESRKALTYLSQLSNNIDSILRLITKKERKPPHKSCHINLILCSNQQIKKLNRTFREKNYATDVLTFNTENDPNDPTPLYAEIYISLEQAYSQAQEHGVSAHDELALLAVHGIIHSTGLDHDESESARTQFKKYERKILNDLGLNNVQALTEV